MIGHDHYYVSLHGYSITVRFSVFRGDKSLLSIMIENGKDWPNWSLLYIMLESIFQHVPVFEGKYIECKVLTIKYDIQRVHSTILLSKYTLFTGLHTITI